jgi:[ribosomal protein S5]-alanine N-acetyltransferase
MSATAERLTANTAMRTKRIALTPLDPRYAGALFALLNDWDVVRMLSEVPWPLRFEDVQTFLASEHEAADDFVILNGDDPIGVCAVKKPGSGEPPRKMPRLGYWIGKRHWGKGYATEAIGVLVERPFAAHPSAERVGAGVFHDNPASRRVLEKLGFSAVASKPAMSRSRGGMVETVDMQITLAEWMASKARRQ